MAGGMHIMYRVCHNYGLAHSIFYKAIKNKLMKKNMGTTDKAIRVLVAVTIAGLYFGNIITGTMAIVLMVLAVVFLLTSLVGFCPIYALLGMNTCPAKK